MSARYASGRCFLDEVRALESWVRSHHSDLELRWSSVLILERDDTKHPFDWVAGPGVSDVEGYEARFQEILESATRGWVNLSAETITDDALVVLIEWFSDPAGARVTFPVSVNFSCFNADNAAALVPQR
jgi:hypothetical protein